jgi:hypothetical protein
VSRLARRHEWDLSIEPLLKQLGIAWDFESRYPSAFHSRGVLLGAYTHSCVRYRVIDNQNIRRKRCYLLWRGNSKEQMHEAIAQFQMLDGYEILVLR